MCERAGNLLINGKGDAWECNMVCRLTWASLEIASVMFGPTPFLSTLKFRVKPPGAAAGTSKSFLPPLDTVRQVQSLFMLHCNFQQIFISLFHKHKIKHT